MYVYVCIYIYVCMYHIYIYMHIHIYINILVSRKPGLINYLLNVAQLHPPEILQKSIPSTEGLWP
jgi:hypothetical protein